MAVDSGASPATGAAPLTIVCFGDSTTAPREPVVVYADVLRAELGARGIVAEVINAGLPSNNTAHARARLQQDVLAHRPTLVIVQFGLNDSAIDVSEGKTEPRVSLEQYVQNLRFILGAIISAGSRAILMTHNPMTWSEILRGYYGKPPYELENPDGMNVVARPYVEAVRTLARELSVDLVDVDQLFRRHGQVAGQSIDELLLDGIHPNDAGQALVAKHLMTPVLRGLGAGR